MPNSAPSRKMTTEIGSWSASGNFKIKKSEAVHTNADISTNINSLSRVPSFDFLETPAKHVLRALTSLVWFAAVPSDAAPTV